MVTSLKYLGRVLTAADEKWPAVVGNLWKARKSWAGLARIMGRKFASPRVLGIIQGGSAGGSTGGSAGGSFILFRDVGAEPTHGTVTGKLPAQV